MSTTLLATQTARTRLLDLISSAHEYQEMDRDYPTHGAGNLGEQLQAVLAELDHELNTEYREVVHVPRSLDDLDPLLFVLDNGTCGPNGGSVCVAGYHGNSFLGGVLIEPCSGGLQISIVGTDQEADQPHSVTILDPPPSAGDLDEDG